MKIKKILTLLLLTILNTSCSSRELLYEGLYNGLQTKERFEAQHANQSFNEIEKQPMRYQEYKERIEVESSIDKKASGWAYTTNQQLFVAEERECKVSYRVSQFKDTSHKTAISVKRDCNRPFTKQIPLHKALLEKIFATYPNEEWGSLSWGSFVIKHNHEVVDWSWSLPIARASANSKEYREYRFKYPNTPYNINHIFVKLANETLAYRELKTIFNELGYDITLSSVEKVFTSKAKNYKLYSVLKKDGVKPKQRLIYDIGMSYFKISIKK